MSADGRARRREECPAVVWLAHHRHMSRGGTTSRNCDPFSTVFGIGRGATAILPSGHPVRMDPDRWDEVMDARRGSGAHQDERAPLPPGVSELERYIWEHVDHPDFRAVADLPHKDWALISCSHSGEVGDDFLAPLAEAGQLCARYGVELVPREVYTASRKAKKRQ
jgi:hypothetical protein